MESLGMKSLNKYKIFIFLSLLSLILLFGLFRLEKEKRQQFDSIERGIHLYNQELAQPGLNLYNSRKYNDVYLMDNFGHVLNSWRIASHNYDVHYSKLDKHGNLYAVSEAHALFKYDWQGNLLWKKDLRAHHDIVFDQEDNLYTLDVKIAPFQFEDVMYRTYSDDLVLINPEGNEISRFNLTELVKPYVKKEFVQDILLEAQENKKFGDFFHINSLYYIDQEVPNITKPGDLIISVRNINLIAIIDPVKQIVKWHWQSGQIYHQHHPVLLPDNRLMLFDNGTKERGYSRVIKIDLYSKKIVDIYDGKPDNPFFTYSMGGSQPLPNGNILITSSRQGMVFEITPNNEIVWIFKNPVVSKKDGTPEHIYRMERYPSYILR